MRVSAGTVEISGRRTARRLARAEHPARAAHRRRPSTCRLPTARTWSGARRASSTGPARSARRSRAGGRRSWPTARTQSRASRFVPSGYCGSASGTARRASRPCVRAGGGGGRALVSPRRLSICRRGPSTVRERAGGVHRRARATAFNRATRKHPRTESTTNSRRNASCSTNPTIEKLKAPGSTRFQAALGRTTEESRDRPAVIRRAARPHSSMPSTSLARTSGSAASPQRGRAEALARRASRTSTTSPKRELDKAVVAPASQPVAGCTSIQNVIVTGATGVGKTHTSRARLRAAGRALVADSAPSHRRASRLFDELDLARAGRQLRPFARQARRASTVLVIDDWALHRRAIRNAVTCSRSSRTATASDRRS